MIVADTLSLKVRKVTDCSLRIAQLVPVYSRNLPSLWIDLVRRKLWARDAIAAIVQDQGEPVVSDHDWDRR